MQTRTMVLGLMGIGLIALMWLGRYDVQRPPSGGGVYVLDRWTGNLEACFAAAGCSAVNH